MPEFSGVGPRHWIRVQSCRAAACLWPRQAKFGRKLEKYRDRRDVDEVSRAWARKQCVLRTLAMLQSMPRDYFVFEDYKDDSGNIIVRSTLKVLKDD